MSERSLDGPECRHGVNGFDPRGCPICTAELARRRGDGVKKANGVQPHPETFDKLQPQDTD